MDVRYYLGFCLIGLCVYSGIVGSQRTDRLLKIVANPLAYVGVPLQLPYVKVVHVASQGFRIEYRDAQIALRIPASLDRAWETWREQLQVGHDVSVRAVVHPEGAFHLQEMHIHTGRRLKVWVSVLALMVLAGILIRDRLSCLTS